jgi:hypothetical protein
MTNFLVLARGNSINTARVVAVSADRDLVRKFIGELAGEDDKEESKKESRSRLRLVTDGDE